MDESSRTRARGPSALIMEGMSKVAIVERFAAEGFTVISELIDQYLIPKPTPMARWSRSAICSLPGCFRQMSL